MGLPKVAGDFGSRDRMLERYAPKDSLLHILHSGSAKQANHKSSKGLMALSLEVYDLDSVTIKFLYKHSSVTKNY